MFIGHAGTEIHQFLEGLRKSVCCSKVIFSSLNHLGAFHILATEFFLGRNSQWFSVFQWLKIHKNRRVA